MRIDLCFETSLDSLIVPHQSSLRYFSSPTVVNHPYAVPFFGSSLFIRDNS
jgi:hypothetical protein